MTHNPPQTASSWREMVRAIEAEKRSLPWQPQDVPPLVRVTMLERKTKERELDPVLMQYINPQKERVFAETNMTRTHTLPLERLETIKKTQFNIVSHQGGPTQTSSLNHSNSSSSSSSNSKSPSRGYHLFSHLPPKEHVECPMQYNEKYMTTHAHAKTRAYEPQRGRIPREFDLISNNFCTNHEERVREEHETMKEAMVKKYWATHKFDVLRQEYYDDAAEEAHVQMQQLATQTHGKDQVARLPKSTKYSEGRAYDILNHEVKDADLIKIALRKGDLERNRLTKFKKLPEQQTAQGVAEFDRWAERKLNRVSFKRWESEAERGFDFVLTTKNKEGREPLPKRPPSVWKRINNDVGVSSGGDGSSSPGTARESQILTSSTSSRVPSLNMSAVRTGGLSDY